jgi:hypothetical protein
MNKNTEILTLEINGFTVIRDFTKSSPWEVYREGKKIQSFKSFLQVSKFICG